MGVAVILPNGPKLALALLVVSTYRSCVPLNALSAIQELEADLLKAAVDHVIGLAANTPNSNPAIDQLLHRLNIPFTGLSPVNVKASSLCCLFRNAFRIARVCRTAACASAELTPH